MDWKDLGKEMAQYAPLLGGVIGGPAGGAIGSIVASVFGVDNKPDLIAEAIKNDPEAAMKLKTIELDNKVPLQEIAAKIAIKEIDDKQNSRIIHKHSKMPATLSIVLSLVVVGIICMLFLTIVPSGSKDVLFVILGAVLKEWGGAMQYWFGTTRSSADKDQK